MMIDDPYTYMPYNEGIYDFFEWGNFTTTDENISVLALFLRPNVTRNDIINLLSEHLLRPLSFVVVYDCTAPSFAYVLNDVAAMMLSMLASGDPDDGDNHL